MEYLLLVALVLLSPAILVVSLVFPFFWIGQYRLLRRSGSWRLQQEFQGRWVKRTCRGVLVAYIVCLGAILLPHVFPVVHSFLASGGMLGAAVPIVVDVAILMAYPPDAAVEQWRAEQQVRER